MISKFLNAQALNYQGQKFVVNGIVMFLIYVFLGTLTNTFFILYALERVDFAQLGLLIALQFSIQIILDYPTAALGDWLGQRRVLASASVIFGISFIILSQANDIVMLALAFSLFAIAGAQESGAWQSWFDNNYKLYVPEDIDRTIFTSIFSKYQACLWMINAIGFIVGGILVTLFSRGGIFLLQGFVHIFYSFIFFKFMKDHPNFERMKPELKNYFRLLMEGLTTTYRNKTLRLILIGMVISSTAFTIWGNFLLFPTYASYGKSDSMTALIRAIIFLSSAISFLFIAKITHKLAKKQANRWLAVAQIFGPLLFFILIFTALTFMPAEEKFSMIAALGIILAIAGGSILNNIQQALMPRVFLDLIPDRNRNSVYSLIPTLVLLGGLPAAPITGFALQQYGTLNVILFLAVLGTLGGLIIGFTILSMNGDLPKFRITKKISSEPVGFLDSSS